MAENQFLKNAHLRGLIDEREIAFLADIACTNGNGGRAFCFLNGSVLSLYACAGIAETGDLIEAIDLKDAKFLKGSSFVLHPTMKLQYNGNTYSMQGFTQAKKMIDAVKSACGE